MQPEPSGSSVRPSDGGRTVLQGEISQRLKRKACGGDSRKKFLKVSADFVASPQTSYHRVDVSDVSAAVTAVNGLASDPSPIAFKRGTVKNEKIYLDLKDGQLTQDLEKYITRFGGIVEKFLSKDITCVVTSRIDPKDTKAEDACLKKEAFSPCTAEKPKPDIYSSLGAMSRGKALLLRSNSTKASSSSAVCGPVQFAHTWKIPVVEVSVLRNLLRKENNHRKQVSSQSSKPTVKKLDKPYVKVEDAMQMYNTSFKLFNSFPMSYLAPLDSLPPCNGASQSNESTAAKKKTKQTRVKKSGYCECCDISFVDEKEHFNSRMHKAFVMRNENFASLDALVSKLPSLEKFALAVELDRKNLSSSRSTTGVDPGLVDSQPQDHHSNPSFAHDVAVHGTKRRLYPGSRTNFKHDVKDLYDAQHVKSNGTVSPATVFTPNSSCPTRKPRTKKSQTTTSSKSCTRNSDSFHAYEKCEDDRNLIGAGDRHAGKLASKSRMPDKDGRSELDVDLNCPVDLSLPKSSTRISLHQSSVSSLSTVSSELNCAHADTTKISKFGKGVKISKGAEKMKLATSNCSDRASDSIGDPKMTRHRKISERMNSSLDLKLLAAPVISNNAELRSPFLSGASTISLEVSKDDDLEFSSDEVSDSADEKVDWKINLRNSCNKVLNILEDSNSSKDLAKDVPDDCSNNSTMKPDVKSNTQTSDDCHTIGSDKTAFNFSSLKGLSTADSGQPAFGIQPDLDVTEKAKSVGKVSSKETSLSCRVKPGSIGIVRPWEMASNKPETNQLRMDKESHCNVGSQMLDVVNDSSGCVLPTDCDQRPNSNKVHRQIKSNRITTATRTAKALLPEATHSDDDSDRRTKHPTGGNNNKERHLNDDCHPEKAHSAESTAVKSDICTVESAAPTAVSGHVPEKKILHSPAPVEACIAEHGAKAETAAEIFPAAIAESPTRFQDSPHSSSQSSIIVDVETCDERSENCRDKDQTFMPHYEPITPVKPRMPPSLEAGDKGIAFGSSFQGVNQRVIDQQPSWPTPPVSGQVVYLPMNVKDIPMSPTGSQPLVDTSLTNDRIIASQFLPGVNGEFQMQKRDSACSSLDSGYCASIKTVAVDSCPGSPVENCARDVEEGETSDRELKCIPSQTENPVSSSPSPAPILAELPDSLSAAKQAENVDGCTSEIPINADSGSQCKTTEDSVRLRSESEECPASAVTATPETPLSIPVPIQTEISDLVNLQFQGESAGSLAAPVNTLSPSSVSIQAANNDDMSSPVLCQTKNDNSLVSGQTTNHDSTQILIQAENSNSLPILILPENSETGCNQEEKSDSNSAADNAENQCYSLGAEKHAIDEVLVDERECKDVLIEPALPETNVKKVDALEDLACAVGHIQESSKAVTVPEVQTYPDLMSGINELPEKSKMQMPDLLMETKNDTALDSPCSSNCPLPSTEVHTTLSEAALPPGGGCYSGSEPMDVGFAELSEDFFTARSNPITFYGIDKSEEIPWTDNAWGPAAAHQTTETAAAAVDTTWPEELATIVQSDHPNDFSSGCYVGLDNLMMSAPIGTPKCVSFSDDESCLPTTAKKENPSAVVSSGPKTEIRSGNSVNTVAEPSVLDDVVLTALSKILEDASKEWQAERQKSNSTDGETASSTLSVCVADKELKEETYEKISGSHTTTSVEIPTSPPIVMQTSKPIVPFELQSVQIEEANEVIPSDALCTVSESNSFENGSSLCIDGGAQLDQRPVTQTVQLCADDAEKELDETSKTEPFSTVSTPAGELDDLDRLMEMLKALNEETKCSDESELTSSCNAVAANSCQTLTKDNSSELVLPNNFCDSFDGISFAKTHKTSRRQVVAATGNPFHVFGDGSSSISANHFSNDVGERAAHEKNRKDRCEWKMTYVSGLKFLFQRLLRSPDQQSRCFGKYSIKSLGSERLALRISKNKSRSNIKS